MAKARLSDEHAIQELHWHAYMDFRIKACKSWNLHVPAHAARRPRCTWKSQERTGNQVRQKNIPFSPPQYLRKRFKLVAKSLGCKIISLQDFIGQVCLVKVFLA